MGFDPLFSFWKRLQKKFKRRGPRKASGEERGSEPVAIAEDRFVQMVLSRLQTGKLMDSRGGSKRGGIEHVKPPRRKITIEIQQSC